MGAAEQERTRAEPRNDAYDVVVIGSGLGGLSAAALLAHAGRSVLVVEQADGPGGCAHAFTRGPYVFDPAIHFTLEGEDGGFLDSLLRHLDVRDDVTFVPMEHVYGAAFPSMRIEPPVGQDPYVEAHVEAFPHEEEGIRGFYGLRDALFGQISQLPTSLGLGNLEEAAQRFPLVFKYRNATLATVLDEFIDDPQAKSAITAIWPYFAMPPSRLSFVYFIQFLSVLVKGPRYSLGGFQRLADAFVTALERDGGELVVGTPVVDVEVADGKVSAVSLDGGARVEAPVVIANADATHTFEELVGLEHLTDAFAKKLRRLKPTPSGFVLYGTSTQDLRALGVPHETFIFPRWDHEETFKEIQEGRPAGIWLTLPSLLDDSLAPAGEHIVVLSALARYDLPWSEHREQFSEELLAQAEAALPGLTDGLTIHETATPESLARRTRAHRGALYGWDYSPSQFGNKRLGHSTPVEGLYLSGQWSAEGGSSFRVMLSGVRAAELVARETSGEPIPSFRPPDLPELTFE